MFSLVTLNLEVGTVSWAPISSKLFISLWNIWCFLVIWSKLQTKQWWLEHISTWTWIPANEYNFHPVVVPIGCTGWRWVSNNRHTNFPCKELPFQIAVLGFTCISWSKEEMWAQLSHHPLISWPTTQWPVFSLLCLIQGILGI